MRVWSARDGGVLGELLASDGTFSSAAFSPDGRTVLTTSTDNAARIWEPLPADAGLPPAWFAIFLRWRAQARLDENGAFRHETGEEQVSTRKELFDALAAYPADEKNFYVQFVRRFAPEGSPATGK